MTQFIHSYFPLLLTQSDPIHPQISHSMPPVFGSNPFTPTFIFQDFKMLCPLCLPFTQSILTDTPVAITHTRPHTPDHALTTTTPTSSEIADGINHQRPCSFHHYPHYRELEGSARAGCELCSLIVNSTSSRPRQNRRQAELQREKPVQFWLPRISKTDDLDAKLRFRVNVGIDTGIDKFSLHLEFYKRCGMFSQC